MKQIFDYIQEKKAATDTYPITRAEFNSICEMLNDIALRLERAEQQTFNLPPNVTLGDVQHYGNLLDKKN